MRGGDVIVVSVEEEGSPVGEFWVLISYIQGAFSSRLKAHSNLEFSRPLGILTSQLWPSSRVRLSGFYSRL